MSHFSPVRTIKIPAFRTPDVPTKSARQVLSLDRAHSHFRTEPNVPLSPDPRARYSISYASGVLEHRIEPCRTLEEAQMRIVLLSCEVERISEVNYRLVRENELLKFQPDRGNRVADLESKLAIILAENEKLVQVVDEIHQFYTTEKAHSATSNIRDFDRVMKQIEEVKQSPRALYSFGEPGIVKAGVSGERSQPGSLNDIIHKNSGISAENERLRKELSALRAKCQELGEMQAKLNRYEAIMKALVIENERLNEMFRSKVICENKEPRRSHNEREEKLTENVEFEVLDLDKAKEENEAMKEYYRVQELDIPQLNMKAEELIRENKRLYNEMKRQYDSPVKNALAKAFGSPTQSTQSPNEKKIRGHVEVLLVKNEELHNLVNEMHLDADDLRRRLREAEFSKDTQVRSLNSKVDVLQSEKAALNGALKEKETSLQLLKIEKDRVDGLLKEKRNELELIKVGSPIKEQGLTFQIRNLETEVRELKRKLDVANVENDRLNAKIKDLTANPQDESLNKQLNKARIENEEFLRTMRALDESRRQQIPGGVYAEPDKAFDVGKIANVGDYMHQHVYQAKSGNEELLKSMRALEESRTKSLTSSPTRSHLQATDDILNKQLIAARVENDDLRRRLEAEQREKGSTESIQILTKENERLSALLAGTRSQNEDLMRKISNLDTTSRAYILEAENKTLKKEIEDLKIEISVLKAENRRLDSLVIEKARDIETLKASLEGKERLISGLSMSMSGTGRSGSIEAPYEKHTMLRSDMLRQPDVVETKDQEIKRLNESLGRAITEQEKLKKEVLIKQKTIDSLVVSKIKPEGDISPLGADNVRLTQSAVYGTGSDVHEELKKTKNELKDLQAKVHILQGENDGLKKQLQVKDIHLDLQLQGSPKSPGSRAGSLENVGAGQVVVGAENIQNVQRRVQVLENENRKLKEFAQSKEGGNKLLVELQTISNQALASQVGQTGQAGQAGHVSQVTSVQAGQIGQIGQTGQTGYVSHVTSAEIGGHQDVLDVGHQVTQLKQENERLNGIIEAKGTEVRSLREDIEAKKVALDTYKAYQQEGGEAKRKLEIMTNENKMLKNLVNDKERAFINLNTKLMQLTQELTEGPGSVLVGQDESRTRTSPPTIHGQVGPQAVEGPKTAEERAIEGQIEALRKIIATKATVNEGSPRARQEERGRGERSPNRSLDKSQGSPKGSLTRGATGSPKAQGSPRVATTGSPKGHGGESRVQGSTSGTTRVATSPTGTPKGQVAGAKGVSGRTESPQASPKGQAGTKVSGAVERSGTAGTPKGGQAGRVGARGAAPARLETSGSRTESPQTSPKGQSVINKSLSGVGDREGTEGSLERQGESRVQQGSTRIATSPTSTPKGHVAGVKGVAGRTESPQTSPKGQAAINKSLGGTSKVVNSPTGTPRGGESAAGTGRGVSGKVSRTGSGVGSPQASPREGKVEGANKYRPSPLGTPKGQAGAAGKSVLGKGDARARTTESPQTSPKGQGVINRSLSGAGDRDRTEGSLERQGEGKGVARRVERSPNMQLEGPELLNELVALEDENEKLREIIDTREKEMHEIAEISLEIKSEITSIKQENERLIGIIHDKVGEIRMLKKQMESGQRSVETTAHDEEEIRRQTEQLVNQARQEVRNIVEDRGELRNINISLKSSGVNMNTNVLEALSGDFSNEPKVEKVEEKPRTKQEYERVFDDKNAEIRALKKAIEVKDRALESFKDSLIEADREEKDKFEAMELENKQLNELLLAVKKKGTKSEILKMTEEKQHAQKEAVQLKRHNTQLLNTLDEKQSEIENLLNSLDEKDRTLESVKGFDSGMNDLEKMVEMLVAENERLKDLLNQKMAESKRLREERNKARKELSKMGNTREEDSPSPISSAKLGKGADAGLLDKLTKENMRMMRNLEEKDRQIQELTEDLVSQQRAEQELKEEIADEIENLKYDARKSEDEKRMAEEKISRLNTEIERVQGHLNRTMRELQDEKKKFSELDVLRAQEIDRIRQQFEAIDKNDIELGGKELIAQFEAERLAYETQIEQIQTNLTDLEREHKVLKDENKELRKLSATRLREVEEMKRQAAELKESFNLQSIELKSEIGRLKLEKQEIEQTLIKHQSEKNKDQAEIKSLQDLDTNNKGEIKSLNSLMIESKANYHELAEQHSELKKMYDNLKNEVQDKALESMQRLEKLDILEREVNELEKSKLDYKKRAERNSYELMKKNRELVESIQTLEAARLKYQEVVMSYQSVNTDRSLQDA